MKAAGRGKKYDAVIGVSGGCDSSYLVHQMKEVYGLRLLAAHFDNTWNSTIATENIHNVLDKLGVDLFTIVVDNKEYDDLYDSDERKLRRDRDKYLNSNPDFALARLFWGADVKPDSYQQEKDLRKMVILCTQ